MHLLTHIEVIIHKFQTLYFTLFTQFDCNSLQHNYLIILLKSCLLIVLSNLNSHHIIFNIQFQKTIHQVQILTQYQTHRNPETLIIREDGNLNNLKIVYQFKLLLRIVSPWSYNLNQKIIMNLVLVFVKVNGSLETFHNKAL